MIDETFSFRRLIQGHPTRLIVLAIVSVFMISLAGGASAQPWQRARPTASGWSSAGLKAVQDYAASLKPTAVMVVQDGKVIAS